MGDEAITKPTLETLLERMVSMEERISSRINALGGEVGGLRDEVTQLRGEVSQLRDDMNAAFRKVEDKIDVLNQNILGVSADYRDLKRRVENLEKNAA
jgi:predicted RNase H-like nuclease (RuvC/YqgF family)